MAADCSSATVIDRRHYVELVQAQMPGMGGPVGKSCNAEDVGDLVACPHRLSPEVPPVWE